MILFGALITTCIFIQVLIEKPEFIKQLWEGLTTSKEDLEVDWETYYKYQK